MGQPAFRDLERCPRKQARQRNHYLLPATFVKGPDGLVQLLDADRHAGRTGEARRITGLGSSKMTRLKKQRRNEGSWGASQGAVPVEMGSCKRGRKRWGEGDEKIAGCRESAMDEGGDNAGGRSTAAALGRSKRCDGV